MTCPRPGCRPYSAHGQLTQTCFGMGTAARQRLGDRGGQVGVSPSLERDESPSFAGPRQLSSSEGPFGSSGARFRNPIPHQEGGGASGFEPDLTWVLRSPVRCAEGVRGLETRLRPLDTEHIFGGQTFPYGNGVFYPGFHATRGLGCVDRSTGCILPSVDSRGRPEISPLHMERSCISVQGSALWPSSSPLALHQDHERTLCSGEASGDPPEGVHRRLAAPGQVSGYVFPTSSVGGGALYKTWVCHQRGEDGFGSCSAVPLPGHVFRHSELGSLTVSPETAPPTGFTGSYQSFEGCDGSSPRLSSGYNGVDGPLTALRPPPQAAGSAAFHAGMAGGFEELVSPHSSRGGISGGDRPVAGSKLVVPGCPDHKSSTSGDSIHRCLPGGLGRSSGQSDSSGSVADSAPGYSHQSSGAGSCLAGSKSVCGCCCGQTRVSQHRQHVSGVLHKQTRGRSLSLSVPTSRTDSAVVSGASDSSDGKISAREAKCAGRCSQQVSYDSSYRVDIDSQDPGNDLESVVQASRGLVRHPVQQAPSSLCIASSGSGGLGCGRVVDPLGKSAGLRLPTIPDSGKSHSKSAGGSGYTNPGSSSVGVAALVPRSSEPRSSGSSSSQSGKTRPGSTKVRDSTRKSKHPETPRLASVRQYLSMQGASDDVIELVEHAHRPGTKKVYKARWISWCGWCKKNSVAANSPSHVDLANYLAYLTKVRRLSASAVKGHRAAISTTLRQMGLPSFSDDPLLKDVVKGVALKEARCPKRFPAWDVFLVLQCLRLTPFEPIDICELKFLTYKTVFLIALASGRRCSEVHALAYSGLATEQDGSISIRFLPEFLAKNQPSSVKAKPILVRRLASLLCPDDEDITLCPVRALNMYIKRTKFLRTPAKRRLFVSFREDKRSDIGSPSISRWIKSVIQSAYSTDVGKTAESSRSHEVRAWAASLAWANNASLQSIMEAGYWFSQATFIQFYLRDVSHQRMDGTRAISFVAAQLPVVSSKGSSKDSSRRHGSKHSKSSL